MPYDDPIDDEEWYDDGSSDDSETGHCPECGAPIYDFADKCPACGYLLTAADRRRLWSSESNPAWIKITAAVVLALLVLGSLRLLF